MKNKIKKFIHFFSNYFQTFYIFYNKKLYSNKLFDTYI